MTSRRARSALLLAVLLLPAARAQERPATFADDAALRDALAPRRLATPRRIGAPMGSDEVGPWLLERRRTPEAALWLWRWDALDAPPRRVPLPGAVWVRAVAADRELAVVDLGDGPALVSASTGARASLPLPAVVARFGARGRLVVGGEAGAALLQVVDGSIAAITSLGVPDVRQVALAADADRVALADEAGRVHVVDVEGGAARAVAVLERPAPATAVALDASGRAAFTGHADGAIVAWDLAAGAPRVVAVTSEGPGVDWFDPAVNELVLSADGRWVVGLSGGGALLARVEHGGGELVVHRRAPMVSDALPWPAPGALDPGDAPGLLTLSSLGLEAVSVAWLPPAGRLRVGGDELAWRGDGSAGGWPWLSARARWDAGVTSEPGVVRLEVEVKNLGDVAAAWLVAHLEVEPPLPEGELPGRIHLGGLAPGASATRTVEVPRHPALEAGDRALRLRFEDPAAVVPPPLAWQHLPRLARDADAFDALAARIHDATTLVLREALGDPAFDPALERLGDDEIGFTTGSRDGRPVVRYQNPFRFTPAALDGNRRATGAEDALEVARDAELMLWWYLPHEAVHAARRQRGLAGDDPWVEEWVAATLQPALVARVLGRLREVAPYDLAAVLRAVERWAGRLERRESSTRRARVDAFVASAGTRPPEDAPAWQVFREDVGFYVYLLSRTSLAAAARGEPLDALVARLLSR